MTQQATKALNKQVKQAFEKTIDLRSLAQEPPKENAQECLRLMGMALKNLASHGRIVAFELSFGKTTTLLQSALSLHTLFLAKVLKLES